MIVCPDCKFIENDNSSLFCQNCGKSFAKKNQEFGTPDKSTLFSKMNKFPIAIIELIAYFCYTSFI